MQNLILHPTSTHTTYFWRTPLPQKQQILEKMWWWCHHHIFSGISCFWGSGVHQKYAVWVLVGCRIKIHIQQALPLEISVKTQGYMSKIRKKSSFLLWQICQFNHYGWLILLKFYWFLNFNSQEFIVGLFSYKSHFRPQISSNGLSELSGFLNEFEEKVFEPQRLLALEEALKSTPACWWMTHKQTIHEWAQCQRLMMVCFDDS